jgi:hypothetical protein
MTDESDRREEIIGTITLCKMDGGRFRVRYITHEADKSLRDVVVELVDGASDGPPVTRHSTVVWRFFVAVAVMPEPNIMDPHAVTVDDFHEDAMEVYHRAVSGDEDIYTEGRLV